MKKFEFEKLEQVLISYGVIILGILVTLIGLSLMRNIEILLAFTYVGVIGVLFYSFAKNEHFYSVFVLLGLIATSLYISIVVNVVIGIILSVVLIATVIFALLYYMSGVMKYVLISLIGAMVFINLIAAIVAFTDAGPWGVINSNLGIMLIGSSISLGGLILTIFLMKCNLEKTDFLKNYDCSVLDKKPKEKIILEDDKEEENEKPEKVLKEKKE